MFIAWWNHKLLPFLERIFPVATPFLPRSYLVPTTYLPACFPLTIGLPERILWLAIGLLSAYFNIACLYVKSTLTFFQLSKKWQNQKDYAFCSANDVFRYLLIGMR